MPTKHPRHAITETPEVRALLDHLRAELDGERPNLGELVVLGAQVKLEQLRASRAERGDAVERLTAMILAGESPYDLEAAAVVRREGWARAS